MTPWQWWAGEIDCEVYDLAQEDTREAVIRAASQQLTVGERFQIVEAKSSTAARYEGDDYMPFLRTRNKEVLVVGPQAGEGQ